MKLFELVFQKHTDFFAGFFGSRRNADKCREAVRKAVIAAIINIHPCITQAVSIGFALIDKRVKARGRDKRTTSELPRTVVNSTLSDSHTAFKDFPAFVEALTPCMIRSSFL